MTEKADRALTHRFWSIPIFLGIMAVVFFLTFTIGDWLKGYLEVGIESLSSAVSDGLVAAGVSEMLRSLLVDGILAGVGGILTFLPNIFILFLALAFLEDSGYMARVAFGAILGHGLVPFFAPIGLGFWQIAVALIAGISAKEVVVSSCAVLFGVPNINSGAGMDTLVGILGASGFGQLNAFCLMVFCLLYIPCAAALATIRKESGSTRWMLLSALFQLAVAWIVTFVVYRIGILM